MVDDDICDDLDAVLVEVGDEVTQLALVAVVGVQVVQVARQVALQCACGSVSIA